MAVEDKRIQLHRQTEANWTSTNRILLEAEIGVETDTNAFKIGDGSTAWNSLRYDARNTYDTASNFSSNNPILPSDIIGIESDTGYYKVGDGSTAYNTLLYVNRINYVTGTASNYSFSTNGEPMHLTFTRDATNRTITLEDDADHDGQKLIIEVTGTGAGNVALATSAATVDGETASTWTWNGEGTLELLYDHGNTNYKVINTGIWDSGSVADSGSDINRKFEKYTTSLMVQKGVYDDSNPTVITNANIGTFGWSYYAFASTATLGLTFNTVYGGSIFGNSTATLGGTSARYDTLTTSSFRAVAFAASNSETYDLFYRFEGSWR